VAELNGDYGRKDGGGIPADVRSPGGKARARSAVQGGGGGGGGDPEGGGKRDALQKEVMRFGETLVGSGEF